MEGAMYDKETLQKLYRYCYALTCNEQNAYDLLQNALEKYLASPNTADQVNAYIKRIIRNQFVDDCRRQNIVQFEEVDEGNLPADFDIQTLESIVINDDLVDKVLTHLDPGERELVYFWAVEGYSTSQIAEQMAMPRGTVLSKIYRMRKKLVKYFGNDVRSASGAQL